MNIQQIRQQYPQYDDLSDDELAGALHRKFYSDIPRAEFDAKIGLRPAGKPEQNTSTLGDLGTAFKIGALGSTKALTDVAGAGNTASSYLRGKIETAQGEYSPERQAELQRQAQRAKAAEDSGSAWNEAVAAFKDVVESPGQTAAQALGSLTPYIPALIVGPAAAAAVKTIGLGARAVTAITAIVNSAPRLLATAQGAGAVKGAIYDRVYEAEKASGVPDDVAKRKATEAQAYLGKNIDQIAIGLAGGYVAGSSGVERLLTPGAAGLSRKLAPRIAQVATPELLTEGMQGAQEQLAGNIALQREGYNTPALEGVAGAGVREGLAGLLGAAPLAAVRGPSAEAPAAPPPQPTAPQAETPAEPEVTDDEDGPDTLDKLKSAEDLAARLEAQGKTIEANEMRDGIAKARARIERTQAAVQKQATEQQAQQVLGSIDTMDYATMAKTKAALEAGPKSGAATQAIKALTNRMQAESAARIEDLRRGEAQAKESALGQADPDLFGMVYPPAPEPQVQEEVEPSPLEMQDPRQIGLFEAEQARKSAFAKAEPDLFGNVYPKPKAPRAVVEPEVRPSLKADALQMPLDMRPAPEPRVRKPKAAVEPQVPGPVEPTVEAPAVEPAPEFDFDVEAPLTAEEVQAAGAPAEFVGRTRFDLLMQASDDPTFAESPGVATLLGAEPVTVPEGDTDATTDEPRVEPTTTAGGRVRSQPAATAPALEPSVGALERAWGGPQPTDAAGAGTPNGAGVVDLPGEPGVDDGAQGAAAPALKVLNVTRTSDPLTGTSYEAELSDGRRVRIGRLNSTESMGVPGWHNLDTPVGASSYLADTKDAALKRLVEPPARNAFEIPKQSTFTLEAPEDRPGRRTVKGTRYRVPDAQEAPKKPISYAELRRTVSQITKSLGLPEDGITILDDVRQFDTSQRPGSRSGVVSDGQVYLFRSGINSGIEGQKTIFHELLHRGLRNLIPMNEYVVQMDRLYRQFPQLREAAAKWLTDAQNQADVAKYPDAMQWAIATEESMAIMAEGRMPPTMLRRLGNWLANIAARLGLNGLARNIRTMGMTELEAFIDDALRASKPIKVKGAEAVRYKTAKPTTPAAQQVNTMLTALNMQPKPQVSRIQQAQAVLDDAIQNPRASAQTFKQAGSNWVDRFGNAAFSSNFAFNAKVRAAVQGSINQNPAAMGMLLSVTDSQPDASAVMAGVFTVEGNLEYQPDLYKYKGAKATSLKDVATTISDMGKKHGLTPEQASQVVDSYFEARSTESLQRRNDEIELDAQAMEAVGFKQRAEKHRKLKVKHLKDPAWVAQAMQFAQMFPELQTVADQWNEVRANAAKLLVDSGLWTPEYAADMLAVETYVPLYREGQFDAGKGPKEYISGLQVKAKEARLRGSERAVNDIFDNMVRWTQNAVERAVRNRAANARVDVALQLGFAKEENYNTDAPNTVTIWKDGVQRKYSFADPLMVDAFTGLESIALPSMTYWAKVTNLFRQSIVLNPLFGMLQVPQDAIAAIYTSGLKPRYAFTVPARAVKEFLTTLLTPESSRVHRELRALGAVGARDTTADVVRMDLEIMEGARSQLGFSDSLIRGTKKLLHHVAMASDAAVRQAVYTAALDQGLSQAEAVEKAFQLINFRNRGTSKGLALAARAIPFLNAYLAAQHVAYKTITGGGISPTDRKAALQTLAITTVGMMTLSTIYAMTVAGDEGYEKRPGYVRDRVFVIPGTGGLSIPMRADIFAFPKVIAEHMWHHITESGTVDGANTRRSLRDLAITAVAAPHLPQALKPLAEVAINYDFFRQRPLAGAGLAKTEKEYQFTDASSELAKVLGQAGVFSPIEIDHLIRGYLGSLGGLILYGTNDIIGLATGNPRPDMPLWDAIATFPGASTLLPKQNDSAARQDFYELKEAVDRVAQTITLLNGRNPDELEAYLEDPKVEARDWLSKEVNQIYRAIAEIRKDISVVRNNRTLTPAQKEQAIKELQAEELEILQEIDVKQLRKEAQL